MPTSRRTTATLLGASALLTAACGSGLAPTPPFASSTLQVQLVTTAAAPIANAPVSVALLYRLSPARDTVGACIGWIATLNSGATTDANGRFAVHLYYFDGDPYDANGLCANVSVPSLPQPDYALFLPPFPIHSNRDLIPPDTIRRTIVVLSP